MAGGQELGVLETNCLDLNSAPSGSNHRTSFPQCTRLKNGNNNTVGSLGWLSRLSV